MEEVLGDICTEHIAAVDEVGEELESKELKEEEEEGNQELV